MSLVQGSEEWLNWRGKGLGSSDAAVLLGVSPWRTFDQLVLEKRGLWKASFNEYQVKAMDRGKRLEPIIRSMTEAYAGLTFPDEAVEHPDHPFMRASFDGVNREESQLIEIKAGNLKDHLASEKGKVPAKYMPQIQWQLLVGNIDSGVYVSWNGPEEAIEDFRTCAPSEQQELVNFFLYEGWLTFTEVLPDPEMQEELLKRAVWAWRIIQDPNSTYAFNKWTSCVTSK